MNNLKALLTFGAIIASLSMNATARIVVGAQFGDEGKGKMVDYLSADADIVVRGQGGNNAGHTIVVGDSEYKLHLIPSGILNGQTQCILGGGVVLNPRVFLEEVVLLEAKGISVRGRLWISPYAHVILPYHELLDGYSEDKKSGAAISTTRRGIGPCYADKINRVGVRVVDLFEPERLAALISARVLAVRKLVQCDLSVDAVLKEYTHYVESLREFVKDDCEIMLDDAIQNGKQVLFEGAQGTFLDNTYGTFPFVTSSSTIAAGVCGGVGIGPSRIDECIAVVKAFTTRVGNGPFVTEMDPKECPIETEKGREIGVTTGRHRRIGWFDAVLVKTAVRLNGANAIALTKLDVLDEIETIKICVGYEYNGKVYDQIPALCSDLSNVTPMYEEWQGWLAPTSHIKQFEDLPEQAKQYIQRIEQLCGATVQFVSVGPEREQTIRV